MEVEVEVEVETKIKPSIHMIRHCLTEDAFIKLTKKEEVFNESMKNVFDIGKKLREYNDYLLRELVEIKKSKKEEIQAEKDSSDSPLMTDVKAEDDNSSFRKSFLETRQKKLLKTTKNMPFDVIQSEQGDEVVDVLTVDPYNTDNDDDDDVIICPLKSHDQATYNDEATTNGIISYSSNNFLFSVRNRLLTKACKRFSLIVEKLPLQSVSQATNFNFIVNKLPPRSKNDSDEAYSKKPKPLLKDTSHGVIPSSRSPAVMVEKDSNESISQRIISRRSRRKPLTMPTKSRSVSTISTRSSVKQTKQQPAPQIESTQETLLKSHNNYSQGTSKTTVKSKKSGEMLADGQIQSSTSNNTTHKNPVAAIAEEDPLVRTLPRQQTSSRNNKRHRVQSPNKQKPAKKTTSKNKKQPNVPKSSSANQLTSTKPSELITSTLSTSHSPPSLSDSFLFSTESSLSTMKTETRTHSNDVTPSTNDTTSASLISEASSLIPQGRRRSLRRSKLPMIYNEDEYDVSLPSTIITSNSQLKVNSLTECSKPPQRKRQNKKPITRPSRPAKTLKPKKGIKHSESSIPTSTTQKTRNSSKQNKPSNELASNKTTTSTSEPCVTTRSIRKKNDTDCEAKEQQLKQYSLDVKPSRRKRGRPSNISSSEPSLIKMLNSSKQPEVKKTLTQPTKPTSKVNEDDELHSVPIFSDNHHLSDSSVSSGFSLLEFSDFTVLSGEFDDDFQLLDSKTSHSNRNQEIAKLSETTKPSPFNKGSKRNQPLPVPGVSESFPSTDGQSHIADEQTRRGKRQAPTSKPPSTKRAKRTVTSKVSTKPQQASVDSPSTNTRSKAQSQLTNTTKCSQATQTSPFISDTHITQQPVSTGASNIRVNLPVKRTQNKKRIMQTSSLVKKRQTNELTSVPSSLIKEVIDECSSSSSSSSSDLSYSAPISTRLSSRSTVPSSQSTRNFKSIKKPSPATKSTTKKLQKDMVKPISGAVESENSVVKPGQSSKPPEYLANRLSMLNESRMERSVLGSKKRLLSSSLSSSFLMVNNPNPSSNEKLHNKDSTQPPPRPKINPHMMSLPYYHRVKDEKF